MQYYTLENKQQDAAFLAGQPVICPIALHREEAAAGTLHEGASIVVMLSNRAKYKARIVSLACHVYGAHASGEMTIVREVPA